jgi:hypothetical protein
VNLIINGKKILFIGFNLKRVLLNTNIDNFEYQISESDILLSQFSIYTATAIEIKEYILNALKQLKSKINTSTIVLDNSNNYTVYSALSGKSEAVESSFGFMGIVYCKIIFKL